MITDRPTVFVVDDDNSVRKGLDRLLKLRGYRVESFASAEEFLQEDINVQVACLVLDVNLPGLNGLDVQNFLMQHGILLPIVFITGHGDIPTAVRAVKSGAISFLTKPFGETELVTEIENAFAICRNEFQQRSELADIQHRYATLTERESEILAFVVSGKLNKQTAYELGIVENTVKVHRRRVMRKMHAESVAELVLMTQKLNLVGPQPRVQAGR
ncbi:MAG TPA: response regulator [Candidatus Polarisedimenticolia bacterium]|nr:response regulator [Candidatus Polarisedimenticolia bacterium]